MTGAVGISRLIIIGPCHFNSFAAGITRRASNANYTCAHSNKTLWSSTFTGNRRTLTTSRVLQKRISKINKRESTTISSDPPAKKSKSKTHKNAQSLIERTSQILSESSANLAERPAYVTAPSVSAKEMVWAIESSRQEGIPKPSKSDTITVSPEGSANGSLGADPFANQLEEAIKASVKPTYNQRDRSNDPKIDHVQLPDVQAKYLVGPARWETVRAKEVKIKNVTPKSRPNVAVLEHGLDRVLFNPGVHWLQDPRSLVYNFDPYLRTICQPDDFDYTALPEYKPSSMDPGLLKMTKYSKKKFMGSTSSMTSALSQFYFLISAWKPLKTSHLSEAFSSQPKGFTRISRAPSTIQLVHKGRGVYAVDADKTFDSSTVLMQLGKSMEKMLTSTPEEFSKYTKANSWQIDKKTREQPEAFNYISVDQFLLRSQLDCEDPRLPGKTFDLKTRAAVAIRLDVHNYELNQGYQLRKAHGYLESFEREYYDMMRSAFLKYSLQVRIGQMDGIFVAFHNTARVFGFQYISLDEMDSRLFGTSVMGDECFKNQLRLMNRALEEITTKYPEQDLKITFDTDETIQSMNVWVETLPLGAANSAKGKDVPITFDEKGVPMMQPGADLSLWQIVCYSNINKVPTVGPFELSDRATDDWELRYKIAELKKPHMMNEYHRMKSIQAEILSDEQQTQAALAANASNELTKNKNKRDDSGPTRPPSRRDAMRNTLRRISEAGRTKQEVEDKRHADNEFLLWEPKGYVKIGSPEALAAASAKISVAESATTTKTVQQNPPSSPKSSPPSIEKSEPEIESQADDSIAAKMIRRLKGVDSSISLAPIAPIESVSPRASIEPEASEGNRYLFYKRAYDDKLFKLSLEEMALIRKSMSDPISDAEELEKLQEIKGSHDWLLKTLSPFDDIRLKMIETPKRRSEYQRMNRAQLEDVSKMMGLSESSRSAQVTDDDLRTHLYHFTPRFRCKMLLDFYRNWLPKMITSQENAAPYTSIDDFVGVKDNVALIQAANGIHVNLQMVKNVELGQGFTKTDAIKKAILTQIYYSEILFTDDELKEMGFYPRLFDKTKFKNTKDIMRDVQLKKPSKPSEPPENDSSAWIH